MKAWNSRRSSSLSTGGMVSSSQPLASAAGVRILQAGGNAADAAVAVAAALNVTEPCSTGIGGDAFALYYDATTKKVSCLMGNGAASRNISIEYLKSIGIGIGIGKGLNPLYKYSGLCVSVPGAAQCWDDLVRTHGRLPLLQVLTPAIELAERGAPIHECAADQWSRGIFQGAEAHSVFKPNNGNSPACGEIFRNPKLAETFRTVGTQGAAQGFYSGRIAEAIVSAAREFDGVLDLHDLATHRTEFVEPISVDYKGYRVFETPPPTHGVAALQALQMMERLDQIHQPPLLRRGDPTLVHREIECMRLAYADALSYVTDPRAEPNGAALTRAMLDVSYAHSRASLVNDGGAISVKCGDLSPFAQSDTVYFCVVDKDGNACSMINSNYMGFGTGISPIGCGFTLHNRGYNASLDPNHPNCLRPCKRPYHTIIPGLITKVDSGDFFATFGNMGGFMQPMGHFQLVRNLIDYGLQPQEAVDAPRWYLTGVGESQTDAELASSKVQLEYGYGGRYDGGGADGDQGQAMVEALSARGHTVGALVCDTARTMYGRAQIILRDGHGVLWGGSDPRADGCALAAL